MPDVKNMFLENVLFQMQDDLSENQKRKLKDCLVNNLHDLKVEAPVYELSTELDDNYKYLKMFVAARRLEGMAESTITHYVYYARNFLGTINKNFRDISVVDIQWYLSNYEVTHAVSKRYIDNIRKGINGWFLWLEEQEYIESNPFRKIHKIAYDKPPVYVLTDMEVVNIRDYLYNDLRTRAMVEFLLSTGVRVGEFCAINTTDVDFINNKCIIHSEKKHGKETRVVFLTAEAKKYLLDYLDLREKRGWNNSPALFQSNRKGGVRITERVVNTSLRKIEKALNINKPLTCHIFRKTVATKLHKRGLDNISIAKYLGHEDSSTSEKYYINVAVENLQYSFNKYM